jgi:antitoxin component YwqK of YwqJK toxin-antitoxin module
MTQNFFTKATGIGQEKHAKYVGNKQEMNSTLFPESLLDVFTQVISSYLYIDHIKNLNLTCQGMNNPLRKSITYIYKQICLHYQPHSIDDLPALIDSNGDQFWFKEGELHRDGDLPAGILSSGGQYWCKEGKIHRDGDLPAIIKLNGDQEWYKEGKLHRDGELPAIIKPTGSQYWYKEGKLHRDGDLPAIIFSDGDQYWYKEGEIVNLQV